MEKQDNFGASDHELAEARRVLSALQSFIDRIEQLVSEAHRHDEVQLKADMAKLKSDIKTANKHGTIDGSRDPASEVERMFYSKAIQDASSNFNLRVDVSPSNPKWTLGLNAVRGEISYHLDRLRKAYPEV